MNTPAYRSTEGLRRWLVPMLLGAAVIAVVAAVSSLFDMALWNDAATDAANASPRGLVLADNRRAALVILQLLWLVATGVVFMIWFHRLYRNLRPLGAEPTHSGLVPVGGFLVPIMNLFVPFMVAREVATKTGPDTGTGAVNAWWAVWLFAGLLGTAVGNVWTAAVLADEIADALRVLAVYELVVVAAAVLAVRMVGTLTRRQEGQAERLGLLQA